MEGLFDSDFNVVIGRGYQYKKKDYASLLGLKLLSNNPYTNPYKSLVVFVHRATKFNGKFYNETSQGISLPKTIKVGFINLN